MDQRDSIEFAAAVAIGAVIGAGAVLLLRPHPAMPERVLRQLRHSGKRLGRGARHAAHEGGALASAGREMLDQFRDEVAHMVASAREQVAEDVYAQLRGGSRRHGGRRRRR